jgi:hypothetical protein
VTPEEKVIHDVEVFGWHVIKVLADDAGPAFAYTIGLRRRFEHPELIIFGLPLDVMHAVLNLAGNAIKAGRRYEPGSETDELLEGYPCRFVPFPRNAHEDFLGHARRFYEGADFSTMQCVWPDREGRYPWDSGVSAEFKELQPLPGGSVE